MPAAHAREGWQLTPVLSLEAIRLLVSLGGTLERDLRSAALPAAAVPRLLERINLRTLHAGPKECLDSAGQLAQELRRELGQPIAAAVPRERRDRWGRLLARRRSYRGTGRRAGRRGRAAGDHVPRARLHAAAARGRPAR